jgi:hypothetical protein
MSSGLFDLLSDLAKDDKKRAAFNSDPESLLEEYKIDEETQALIKSNDWEGFGKVIQKEAERYGISVP